MWFSEKALVFVDTRTAAVAVYRPTFSGPRLLRFASERFGAESTPTAAFSRLFAEAGPAVVRLAAEVRAPRQGATVLLPVGAAFPSIVEAPGPRRGGTVEVDESDVVRFRLAPLLPFPIALAEIRTESSGVRPGAVLAQAIARSVIAEGETVMRSLGFSRIQVASVLSAALRGLSARDRVVDLVFGDAACAMVVRDGGGAVEAVNLRLLAEGDDRTRRSIDEAVRAAPQLREIRVVGEPVSSRFAQPGEVAVHAAFDQTDTQQFPFLALFAERGRA